jgi:predicted ATPase
MISALRLENFKSFHRLSIPIAPLSLLSGVNGSGKSTVLQSIAAVRQSNDAGCLVSEGLLLNGELVELGIGKDVLFEYADTQEVVISIVDEVMDNEWRFAYSEKNDLLEYSKSVRDDQLSPSWFDAGFQFLRADRIAPAVVYPRSYAESVRRRFLGIRGQYTPHFLAVHQDELVSPVRARNKDISLRLLDQVNAWLACISPGVTVSANEIGGTDLAQLYFAFGGRAGLGSSNNYRPTNVGFGLTYCLPIVVACLSARPGDLILIENPEAHLHPKGQTLMGELIACTSADGVQVIVESHSDHLLNGIRLSVKRGCINHSDVAFHFFVRGEDGFGSDYISPGVDARGRVDKWPEDFFDEWERSLMELV